MNPPFFLQKVISFFGVIIISGCAILPSPTPLNLPPTTAPKTLPPTWTEQPTGTWTPTWTPEPTLTSTATSTFTFTSTPSTGSVIISTPTKTPSAGNRIPTRTTVPQGASSQWLLSLSEIHFLAISRTHDGGSILLGDVNKPDSNSINNIIIRLDAEGGIRWQKYISYNYHDLFETEDGGILLFSKWGLVKLDSKGNFNWYQSFGELLGSGYFQLSKIQSLRDGENGETIVSGKSGTTITFSSAGEMLDHHSLPNKYQQDTSTSWFADTAIWKAGPIENSGFWISRSGVGGPSWQRTFNFDKFGSDTYSNNQQVLGIKDGGGFFAATIRYLRSIAPAVGIWVARFNSVGEILWQNALDGGIEVELIAHETNEGGILITTGSGYMANLPSSQLRLIRLNPEGEQLWDRWYGDGVNNLVPLDLIEQGDGGFLIVAEVSPTTDGQYYQNLILLKTDQQGLVKNCSWLSESPLDPPITLEPDSVQTSWTNTEFVQDEGWAERLPDYTIDLFDAKLEVDIICKSP